MHPKTQQTQQPTRLPSEGKRRERLVSHCRIVVIRSHKPMFLAVVS